MPVIETPQIEYTLMEQAPRRQDETELLSHYGSWGGTRSPVDVYLLDRRGPLDKGLQRIGTSQTLLLMYKSHMKGVRHSQDVARSC